MTNLASSFTDSELIDLLQHYVWEYSAVTRQTLEAVRAGLALATWAIGAEPNPVPTLAAVVVAALGNELCPYDEEEFGQPNCVQDRPWVCAPSVRAVAVQLLGLAHRDRPPEWALQQAVDGIQQGLATALLEQGGCVTDESGRSEPTRLRLSFFGRRVVMDLLATPVAVKTENGCAPASSMPVVTDVPAGVPEAAAIEPQPTTGIAEEPRSTEIIRKAIVPTAPVKLLEAELSVGFDRRDFSERERNCLIALLDHGVITSDAAERPSGATLARWAGYCHGGAIKTTLASLVRRRLIHNARHTREYNGGYYLTKTGANVARELQGGSHVV